MEGLNGRVHRWLFVGETQMRPSTIDLRRAREGRFSGFVRPNLTPKSRKCAVTL